MPLYLDEIYVNATSPDNTKKIFALLQEALKGGLPKGVTLKAGPWASNEEPKVILSDGDVVFQPRKVERWGCSRRSGDASSSTSIKSESSAMSPGAIRRITMCSSTTRCAF